MLQLPLRSLSSASGVRFVLLRCIRCGSALERQEQDAQTRARLQRKGVQDKDVDEALKELVLVRRSVTGYSSWSCLKFE